MISQALGSTNGISQSGQNNLNTFLLITSISTMFTLSDWVDLPLEKLLPLNLLSHLFKMGTSSIDIYTLTPRSLLNED
jgi:hypothetical protein